jgi:iron complex outermembrane receptor protein
MRLSIWNQIAENEYQDDQVNFTGYQELGEVDRRGVEFAFSYDINEKLNIWGNYAYSMSDIKESSADFAESKGNEVRGTPNNTYSFGVSYDLSDELTVRMNYEGQGDYYVNEKNEGGKFGGYDILSLGLDLETRFGLFTLQVNNLTDEYYEYVYDFSDNGTGTIHSPGDGINASISYSLSF